MADRGILRGQRPEFFWVFGIFGLIAIIFSALIFVLSNLQLGRVQFNLMAETEDVTIRHVSDSSEIINGLNVRCISISSVGENALNIDFQGESWSQLDTVDLGVVSNASRLSVNVLKVSTDKDISFSRPVSRQNLTIKSIDRPNLKKIGAAQPSTTNIVLGFSGGMTLTARGDQKDPISLNKELGRIVISSESEIEITLDALEDSYHIAQGIPISGLEFAIPTSTNERPLSAILNGRLRLYHGDAIVSDTDLSLGESLEIKFPADSETLFRRATIVGQKLQIGISGEAHEVTLAPSPATEVRASLMPSLLTITSRHGFWIAITSFVTLFVFGLAAALVSVVSGGRDKGDKSQTDAQNAEPEDGDQITT